MIEKIIDGKTYYVNDDETIKVLKPPAGADKKTIYSKAEFYELFSDTEQAAIITSEDTQIKKFLFDFSLREYIDITHGKTIQSVNALEQMGLIGTGRANEILGL